jgi:hypothetical protein
MSHATRPIYIDYLDIGHLDAIVRLTKIPFNYECLHYSELVFECILNQSTYMNLGIYL